MSEPMPRADYEAAHAAAHAALYRASRLARSKFGETLAPDVPNLTRTRAILGFVEAAEALAKEHGSPKLIDVMEERENCVHAVRLLADAMLPLVETLDKAGVSTTGRFDWEDLAGRLKDIFALSMGEWEKAEFERLADLGHGYSAEVPT